MTENTPHPLHESLERFSMILGKDDIQKILALQEEPLPTGIRLNSLKVNPQTAIRDLSARYGWQVKSIPFCENAWTIHQAETSSGMTIEHRMGQYYLQDAASMVPVSLFEMNNAYPLILDMAASPGGKTNHLIDRMGDKGFILANDASKGRISALRSVLAAWGGMNFAITNFPGEAFGAWYPEAFDLVLLDAPCSMENLRPTENRPLRETTLDERLRLQERQIQLLTSGLQALKVGGQMVFATCSLAPEEDETVIDAVFKEYPDHFRINDVEDKFGYELPGLTAFKGETFHPDLRKSLRLWPHLTGMSGFFCALLTKHKSIPVIPKSPPRRDFSLTDLEKADMALQDQVFEQIDSNFGLDLKAVLGTYQVELYKRYEQLFLIPLGYISHFMSLPYEYIGMPLGRLIDNDLQPSHEFISRFGHILTRGMIQIDDIFVDQWIAGRDVRHPDTDLTPQGQYLLVVDAAGRNLGLGKLLPSRLRNMLPRQSI